MNKRNLQEDSALSPDETVVQQALSQHLDAEVETLDFNVTSKLAAARRRALAQETARPAWQNIFAWQTVAGGVAAVTVAYVISSQILNQTTEVIPVMAEAENRLLMEDITILAEGDDIEFYQNIEFLEWLESNS